MHREILHLAYDEKYKEIAELIIEHGCNLSWVSYQIEFDDRLEDKFKCFQGIIEHIEKIKEV